jgi:uncharacterized repeat protein (TIGR01451 family)
MSGSFRIPDDLGRHPGSFQRARKHHPREGRAGQPERHHVGLAHPVTVNNTLTYTVTVTNAGPNRSLGTTLTHTLGRRLSLTSVTTSAGTCQGVRRRVTCDIGTLAPGVVVTVTIVTQAVSAGTITNVATVAGDVTDQTPVNNQASATTQITN